MHCSLGLLSRGMSSLTVPSAQSSQTLDPDALLGFWGVDFDMQWICRHVGKSMIFLNLNDWFSHILHIIREENIQSYETPIIITNIQWFFWQDLLRRVSHPKTETLRYKVGPSGGNYSFGHPAGTVGYCAPEVATKKPQGSPEKPDRQWWKKKPKGVPCKEKKHIPPGEKEHHLQICHFWGIC